MARPKPAWRPAPRDGVSASCVVTPDGTQPSMLSFLAQRLPVLSEAEWRARLQRGEVLDAKGQALAVDAPYAARQRLWYWRELPDEPELPFVSPLLYQDEHLVVADKPHFLATAPKGRYARETLLARLQRDLGLSTLTPLHRLDRETAGVVVFGVRPEERHAYQSLFRDRAVHKVYEAVAPLNPGLSWPLLRESRIETSAQFMQMQEVPGEPNARTQIELLRSEGDWGLYRLQPETGRTHQLRVHMLGLGLPLRGDRIYPTLLPEVPVGEVEDYSQPLQLLARELRFTDPLTGEARCFRSQRQLTLA